MVNQNNCINILLKEFPGFNSYWDEHVKFFGGEDAGLSNDINSFLDYTIDQIKNKSSLLPKIFNVIEEFLNKGNEQVKDAIVTSFLESLQNYSSCGRITDDDFVKYLGKKSREYCKEWDEFTGVKTKGL